MWQRRGHPGRRKNKGSANNYHLDFKLIIRLTSSTFRLKWMCSENRLTWTGGVHRERERELRGDSSEVEKDPFSVFSCQSYISQSGSKFSIH